MKYHKLSMRFLILSRSSSGSSSSSSSSTTTTTRMGISHLHTCLSGGGCLAPPCIVRESSFVYSSPPI